MSVDVSGRVEPRRALVAIAALHVSWLTPLFIAFWLAPASHLEAQTGGVTGIVTDSASSRPIFDARVFVPGTTLTAYTDEQGRYVLAGVAAGEVAIRLERTGYTTEERTLVVSADQIVEANFELQVSAIALDALVVTAAGFQRRRELGNGAATIQVSEEMRRIAPVTLTGLLQGRATGVQVLTSSGSVGTAASLRIRGNGSIALSDAPLIYIDGARISSAESGPGVGGQGTSRLNDLPLEDIESIEIVKGPSAATLYGVEASAGVIRITTKRGRAGARQWNFRSEWGANWDDTDWPATVWHPRTEFGTQLDLARLLPGTVGPGEYLAIIPDTLYTLNLLSGGGGYAAPWRTGYEQAFGASLRGGSANVTYFISGEYRDQLGTLSNNESVQRSLRGNFNLIPTPEFDLTISASYANNRVLLPDNDNNSAGYIGVGMLGSAWGSRISRADLGLGTEVSTCPFAYEMQRAIHASGIAADGIPTPTLAELSAEHCPKNPFFAERTFDDIRTLSNVQDVDRFTTSVTAQYIPRDDLTTKVTVGYDQFVDQTGSFVPVDLDLPFGNLSRGFRSSQHATNRILTIDANAIYAYQLTPDLRSTTTAGLQFLRRKVETVAATGRTLPLGSGTVSGAVRTTGAEAVGESRVLGLIVEEQISFRDRLFVTPAVRFDDSSAFGRNLGRAAYPRVGLSYVISEEPWFESFVPGSFLTSLRLRGAWGQSGRQPAAFAALKLLDTRRVTLEDEDVVGLVLAGPGNPELKGERGEEIELGFEASAFDGRFGVDFTWYRKTTRDAIVGRDLAPSTGYAAPIFSNLGEVRNQGAELEVTGLMLNGERVRWDAQVRISGNSNRIVELDEPIIYGLGRDSQRLQEGYPFGAYFSRIYQVAPNGGVASSDSSVYVGQPAPTVEGSAASSVTFGGWVTLSAQMGYALGFQQFNSTQWFRCTAFGGGEYGGVCPELYATDANGELTTEARVKQAAGDDLEIAPWIETADFFRLRSVSLRFEIPPAWLGRIRASGGSFTIAGENLLLLTSYSGLDPEVNFAGGDLTLRADFFTLPPAKRLTGRLSLSF